MRSFSGLSLVGAAAFLVFSCTGEDAELAPRGGDAGASDSASDAAAAADGAATTPSLALELPREVIVARNTTLPFSVRILRTKVDGTLTATLTGLPAGITTTTPSVSVPAGQDTAIFSLVGAPAGQSAAQAEIVASAEGGLSTTAGTRITLRGAPGELDETFGVKGIVTVSDIVEGNALARDRAGNLYFLVSTGGAECEITRVTPSGTFDAAFGSGGKLVVRRPTNTNCSALAVQPDGAVVVAGIDTPDPRTTFAMRVVTQKQGDTYLDPTYGTTGSTALPTLEGAFPTLELDSTGRAIVGGGEPAPRVVRLSLGGAVDATFSPPATVGQYSPGGFTLTSDDRLYATASADDGMSILRLLPAGIADSTFGVLGKVTLPNITSPNALSPCPSAVAVDGATRRIAIAGGAVVSQSQRVGIVARASATGAPEGAFGNVGYQVLEDPTADIYLTNVAFDEGTRVLVAGYVLREGSGGAMGRVIVARFDDQGADPSFGVFGHASPLGPLASGSFSVQGMVMQEERIAIAVTMPGAAGAGSSSGRIVRLWR